MKWMASVKARTHRRVKRTIVEVLVASLSTQDKEASGSKVQHNRQGAQVPDRWIADQVDLTAVFDPEVLCHK